MKKFLETVRSKISVYITPVPEVQEDYVDKVIYLLRRDFDSEQQNKVLLSIAVKLSQLREEDLAQMEKDYANLQENTYILKERLALS
jgi:hypothetical protein